MQRSLRKTLVSAGLVLFIATRGVTARADEPPRSAPTEEQLAEAKAQFTAGVNLLDDPDGAKYEEAYRAFKRAYSISPSPKILGNIAFCSMHLERDGEAIDAYTTYLREVPDISERERAQIQRDLTTLTATVGRAKIVVVEEPTPERGGAPVEQQDQMFRLVDRRSQTRGAPIENVYAFEGRELSLRLRPGRHTFVVKFPDGGQSDPIEATVEPGASGTYEFRPARPTATPQVVVDQPQAPATKQERSSIVGPVVLAAAGLAGVGFGVVSGLVAQGKTSDIESQCPQDVCPATYDFVPDRTSAKTWGTVADVSFVAGGALVLGGLLWYVLLPKSNTRSAAPAAQPTRAAWLPSAGCTTTGCGLQLQRGF